MTGTSAGPTRGVRRRARVASLRALYRAEVVGDTVSEVREELMGDESLPPDVRDYSKRLLDFVVENGEEIDRVLSGSLDRWDLKRLAVIDRGVLRIGTAELLFEPQIPTRVVLDEAIEIAKQFGSSESGRFVNGVLDRVAKNRSPEDQSSEDSSPDGSSTEESA